MSSSDGGTDWSAYRGFTRAQWARLRQSMPMTLREQEVRELQGLGDVVSSDDIEQVYLPLCRLITLYVASSVGVREVTSSFLGWQFTPAPFVIGIAGSVGVGKSTVARLLRALLSRLPDNPQVDLVTTDGFLFPNAELERRGLMNRKGFPESYDLPALVAFLAAARTGTPEVEAPVYSHLAYDVVPGQVQVLKSPGILIIEGLNVLQNSYMVGGRPPRILVSDFLDFTIYVDAAQEDVRQWYIDRFMTLRRTAFRDPASYFHQYGSLPRDEAVRTAARIWDEINRPNLEQNILPTRGRARVILQKGRDHRIRGVRLRKF
jgi:type I pantothenate kinase